MSMHSFLVQCCILYPHRRVQYIVCNVLVTVHRVYCRTLCVVHYIFRNACIYTILILYCKSKPSYIHTSAFHWSNHLSSALYLHFLLYNSILYYYNKFSIHIYTFHNQNQSTSLHPTLNLQNLPNQHQSRKTIHTNYNTLQNFNNKTFHFFLQLTNKIYTNRYPIQPLTFVISCQKHATNTLQRTHSPTIHTSISRAYPNIRKVHSGIRRV